MPGYGIAVAAATMVGQNLGAERPDHARLSTSEANRLAVVMMASMGIIFYFFPYVLLRIFTSDAEVIRYGILYMKIVAFAQVPLAITMVLGGSLRGAGDTGFIMFATIAGMWLTRIPVAAFTQCARATRTSPAARRGQGRRPSPPGSATASPARASSRESP